MQNPEEGDGKLGNMSITSGISHAMNIKFQEPVTVRYPVLQYSQLSEVCIIDQFNATVILLST